jgi:hypothetical protein
MFPFEPLDCKMVGFIQVTPGSRPSGSQGHCRPTGRGEQNQPEGKKEDGAKRKAGVPKGPDCTGLPVTEGLYSGAACAGPMASKSPVAVAPENLRPSSFHKG